MSIAYAVPIRQRFTEGYRDSGLTFPIKMDGIGFLDPTQSLAPTEQPSNSPWVGFNINPAATANGAIGNPRMSQKNQVFSVVVAIHMPVTTATTGATYNENDINDILSAVDNFMLFSSFSPAAGTVIYADRGTPITDNYPEFSPGDNWRTFFRTYNYEYRYKANIPAP